MKLIDEIFIFFINNWKDIIIFITFIALFFQLKNSEKAIKLNIEANNLVKDTIKRNNQIRELELMSKKHFIINTQILLEGYLKDIEKSKKILIEIKNNNGYDKGINKLQKLYHNKEGLLIKQKNKPIWLIEIEETATQYYYNLICNFINFRKGNIDFNINFSKDLIDRANESSFYIKELLEYIKNMIPNVILNCPASINENDFYK